MNVKKTATKERRMKKKISKNKKIIISIVSILLIIVIGGVFAYYQYVKSKIYSSYKPNENKVIENVGNNNQEEVEYAEVKGITNILLIGTDGRTLDENCRADSVIIATVDNNNKKIKLTSLFRDTLVNIPGYGEDKLNAAMAYGGKELLLDTVRQTYNIDIDKYIIINFWGFEAIIDQIGGLKIDVKDYQLDELNKYIGESTGGNDCPVEEAGIQILNGKQSLSYARIRKGVGDEYERTERQREVIFKVAEKLRETKPSKYLGIMNKMLDYINTNIDPIEALNLAYTIFKFPTLDTEQLQMPIPALASDMNYKSIGSVFIMDRVQNTKILHEFIFENKSPNEEEFDYYSLYSAIAEYESEQSAYEAYYGPSVIDEDPIIDHNYDHGYNNVIHNENLTITDESNNTDNSFTDEVNTETEEVPSDNNQSSNEQNGNDDIIVKPEETEKPEENPIPDDGNLEEGMNDI